MGGGEHNKLLLRITSMPSPNFLDNFVGGTKKLLRNTNNSNFICGPFFFPRKSGFYLSLIQIYSYSFKFYFQSLKAAFKECLVSSLVHMGVRKTTDLSFTKIPMLT